MKSTSHFITLILFSALTTPANAEKLSKAYLDQKNNVHFITGSGKHQQITTQGNATLLKLSPDSETITWLVLNTWKAEGDDKPGSEELAIYRMGRRASIKCTPFIRDYWFWSSGKHIAVDCGGRRFAGREILYDVETLKELASFDQADVPSGKRPDWSSDRD